ncbi:hypothetical protein R6Z07F_010836 [Ovis aries]
MDTQSAIFVGLPHLNTGRSIKVCSLIFCSDTKSPRKPRARKLPLHWSAAAAAAAASSQPCAPPAASVAAARPRSADPLGTGPAACPPFGPRALQPAWGATESRHSFPLVPPPATGHWTPASEPRAPLAPVRSLARPSALPLRL